MKAPYTKFGITKNLPVNLVQDGKEVTGKWMAWDEELFVEREEDFYALLSRQLKGKIVRVVTKRDWDSEE